MAFPLISLTDHYAIFLTGPIWVGIICALILEETYKIIEICCAIVAFLGLVLLI